MLDAYDFGRHGTIVDVGGGRGELSGASWRQPAMRGVLFDLPHVVEAAARSSRPPGSGSAAETVAGSFFDVGAQGADAYVLRAVLHDWDDPAVVDPRRRCRPRDGRRRLAPRHRARCRPASNARPDAKFSDLNMPVAPGGRERSIAEYGELLSTAGFRLAESPAAGFGLHVIVGVPMPDGRGSAQNGRATAHTPSDRGRAGSPVPSCT